MTAKAKKKIKKEDLLNGYMKVVLQTGYAPSSVYSFMEDLQSDEAEFYGFYSSFSALEKDVWNGFMNETIQSLEGDPEFADFGSREKLLAFYYTHLEVLLKHRSFVVQRIDDCKKPQIKTPNWIRGYKAEFIDFVKGIVNEAIEENEIKSRPLLSEKYDQAFWLQLLFILDYWAKDESQRFENSDGVIEKSVDLSFRILGETAIDAAIDFAKHIWKSM